jgi:hypothetical protein
MGSRNGRKRKRRDESTQYLGLQEVFDPLSLSLEHFQV